MDTTIKTTTPNPTTKLWMTIIQTAQYLEISRSTVERMLKESGMPYSKVAMTVRIHRDRLDQWLLDHELTNKVGS